MKCVVCGAKLNYKRLRTCPNANTCDPVCTRAKHAKRTRTEQYFADDKEDERLESFGFEPEYHRFILANV